MMDKSQIREVLETCWKDVEIYYKSDSISSERSLQAEMYRSLRRLLGEGCKVLVEPAIDPYIPDIVVVDDARVLCVIEIKCAPHWWVSGPSLKNDIDKLSAYSSMNEFETGIFGPKRVFETKKGKWLGGRNIFSLNDETVFCFAAITRGEAPCSCLSGLKAYAPSLKHIQNFCLLSGAIHVDEASGSSSEEFTVEATF